MIGNLEKAWRILGKSLEMIGDCLELVWKMLGNMIGKSYKSSVWYPPIVLNYSLNSAASMFEQG